MPQEESEETTFRLPRLILVVTLTLVVLVALGVAAARYLDGLTPSHYVSVKNDTTSSVNWSCSWSNLDLGPGDTGRIRILNQPDQDFGCNSGSGKGEIDYCPAVQELKAGRHFTVSSWIRHFTCP